LQTVMMFRYVLFAAFVFALSATDGGDMVGGNGDHPNDCCSTCGEQYCPIDDSCCKFWLTDPTVYQGCLCGFYIDLYGLEDGNFEDASYWNNQFSCDDMTTMGRDVCVTADKCAWTAGACVEAVSEDACPCGDKWELNDGSCSDTCSGSVGINMDGCSLCSSSSGTQDCPAGMSYSDCGSSCPSECGVPAADFCIFSCSTGCFCDDATLFIQKGPNGNVIGCVEQDECAGVEPEVDDCDMLLCGCAPPFEELATYDDNGCKTDCSCVEPEVEDCSMLLCGCSPPYEEVATYDDNGCKTDCACVEPEVILCPSCCAAPPSCIEGFSPLLGSTEPNENGCTCCAWTCERDVDEEENVCPEDMTYSDCGSSCPKKCGEEVMDFCISSCATGCFCDDSSMFIKTDGNGDAVGCVEKNKCAASNDCEMLLCGCAPPYVEVATYDENDCKTDCNCVEPEDVVCPLEIACLCFEGQTMYQTLDDNDCVVDCGCTGEPVIPCGMCCSAPPPCEDGYSVSLGSTDPDENGCTCCLWTCEEDEVEECPMLLCGCPADYEEIAVYDDNGCKTECACVEPEDDCDMLLCGCSPSYKEFATYDDNGCKTDCTCVEPEPVANCKSNGKSACKNQPEDCIYEDRGEGKLCYNVCDDIACGCPPQYDTYNYYDTEGCVESCLCIDPCPEGTEYTDCGSGCPDTCGQESAEMCLTACVSGCACAEESFQVLADDGSIAGCYAEEECPQAVVCSDFDGKKNNCKSNGCVYDNGAETCAELVEGCAQYLGKKTKCKNAGCKYNKNTLVCSEKDPCKEFKEDQTACKESDTCKWNGSTCKSK